MRNPKKNKRKVEYILAMYPSSRNCDIELTVRIWKKYHFPIYDKIRQGVGNNDRELVRLLRQLPTHEGIKRIRAQFQSPLREGGPKYLPTDPAVAKARGWKEEEYRKYLGYETKKDTMDNIVARINQVFNRK